MNTNQPTNQPFNPDIILKRFKTGGSSRPNSSSSTGSNSVLSASDWRKVQALLKKAVEDIHAANSQRLSQTIHSISIENNLLKHENKHLRGSLADEKKRRQQGKPLKLSRPEEYHGGAIFWSPNKVQVARGLESQKQAAIEELQHQKLEEIMAKEARKAEKAQLLQDRRNTKALAKAERLVEQQRKADERAERQLARNVEKQLQSEIKLSKRGERGYYKSVAVITDDQNQVIAVKSERVGSAAAPPRSTRTRKINLPERYKQEIVKPDYKLDLINHSTKKLRVYSFYVGANSLIFKIAKFLVCVH